MTEPESIGQTFGGVRYPEGSIKKAKVETDKRGIEIYTVMLNNGTKLSYTEQKNTVNGSQPQVKLRGNQMNLCSINGATVKTGKKSDVNVGLFNSSDNLIYTDGRRSKDQTVKVYNRTGSANNFFAPGKKDKIIISDGDKYVKIDSDSRKYGYDQTEVENAYDLNKPKNLNIKT